MDERVLNYQACDFSPVLSCPACEKYTKSCPIPYPNSYIHKLVSYLTLLVFLLERLSLLSHMSSIVTRPVINSVLSYPARECPLESVLCA